MNHKKGEYSEPGPNPLLYQEFSWMLDAGLVVPPFCRILSTAYVVTLIRLLSSLSILHQHAIK